MIAIFCDFFCDFFGDFFGGKWRFSQKTNVWPKNANIFEKFLGENIFKIINIGPCVKRVLIKNGEKILSAWPATTAARRAHPPRTLMRPTPTTTSTSDFLVAAAAKRPETFRLHSATNPGCQCYNFSKYSRGKSGEKLPVWLIILHFVLLKGVRTICLQTIRPRTIHSRKKNIMLFGLTNPP
jgi:hypothetical protein